MHVVWAWLPACGHVGLHSLFDFIRGCRCCWLRAREKVSLESGPPPLSFPFPCFCHLHGSLGCFFSPIIFTEMKHREVLSLLCPRFLTSARLTLYGTSFSSSVILRPILFRINCAPLGGCVLMANSTSSDGKDVFARALSPVNFVAPHPRNLTAKMWLERERQRTRFWNNFSFSSSEDYSL